MCALSRVLGVVSSWRYQIPLGLTLSTCLFLFLSSRWTCVLVQKCDLDTLNRLSSSAPAESLNSLGVPLPPPVKLTSQSLCALIYRRGLLVVLPHRIVGRGGTKFCADLQPAVWGGGWVSGDFSAIHPAAFVLRIFARSLCQAPAKSGSTGGFLPSRCCWGSGNKTRKAEINNKIIIIQAVIRAMEEINSKMMNSWRQPRTWVLATQWGRMLTSAYLRIKF